MTLTIQGMKYAQTELNKVMRDVVDGSEEMMTVILMGISAYTKPYVPVDTSALINSERRRVWLRGTTIIGEIRYGGEGRGARGVPVQDYAYYVHEGPQKNWQKSGASNRFLAKGTNEFRREELADIIARYSRK